MPKKSSSKTDKKASGLVKQEKLSSKKPKNEIDEIFSGKKRKNMKVTEENGGEKPKLMKKKKKIIEDKEGRFTDAPVRTRKKTADGLNIYTEEELGFNNSGGGDTPLCPFDCDCCF